MAWLGRAVADDAMVERGRLRHHQRQHRRRHHVAVEDTGSGRWRAAITAAAMATSSEPPTSRSTSMGSVTPTIRRTACCTATRLRSRPASSMPVPRPTHAAVSPPASAAAMAADGSCCRCPSRRRPAGRPRGRRPRPPRCRRSRRSEAGRWPPRTGCRWSACRSRRRRRRRWPDLAGEGADRRAAVAVGVEHRRRHVGGVGAHRLGGGDAVVGGEDQADRAGDAGAFGALPAGDPLGQLVQPGERPARAQDLCGPLVDGGGAGQVGPGEVGEQFVEAGGHNDVQGSVRGGARPATSSGGVGGRRPALVDAAEDVAVAPPELGLRMHAQTDLVADDNGGHRVRSRSAAVSAAVASMAASSSPRCSRLFTQSVRQSTIARSLATSASAAARSSGSSIVGHGGRSRDGGRCARTRSPSIDGGTWR